MIKDALKEEIERKYTLTPEQVDNGINDCYDELAKFYPNEDLKDKYILILQNQTNFPYKEYGVGFTFKLNDKNFTSKENIKNLKNIVDPNSLKSESLRQLYNDIFKDEESLEKFIETHITNLDLNIENLRDISCLDSIDVRIPYKSNNNIFTANMAKNNNHFKYGIPLIFNSLEEMRKVHNVSTLWKIVVDDEDRKDLLIKFSYDITFEEEQGKRLYVLDANNLIYSPSEYAKILDSKATKVNELRVKNYINSFEIIAHVKHDRQGLAVTYIKGDEVNKSYMMDGKLFYEGTLINTLLPQNDEQIAFKATKCIKPYDLTYDFIDAE
ncbi:hypothetical protein ACSW9V_15185 (plasmid) [Clostridium perfringens]|uniref:hypothetical protein n=1 Tax=Clostridium perfringens TaxID=1502 RepID=UPI000B375664|nr:hypothetical protein [Clostridium perfringens]EGT0693569.1 hypothetical protein [Clostridium perfringens]EGT0696526.1 hypothetical protein [Clostridium perfringens]MDU3376226.1 hypothetical protein [Clostridium perfringens]MDU3534182.1 hypothetical protein [Clostridium perfringens]OUN51157.1 hypothetical protein B5G18_13385 [Clostridium perfringens]